VSRWTAANRHYVPFTDQDIQESRATTSYNAALLDKYPAPSQSIDDVLTVGTISVELNRHNYVSQMRRLLQLEEMTQSRIIAKSVRLPFTLILTFYTGSLGFYAFAAATVGCTIVPFIQTDSYHDISCMA